MGHGVSRRAAALKDAAIISLQRIKLEKSLMAPFLERKMVHLHVKNQLSSLNSWGAVMFGSFWQTEILATALSDQRIELES